MKYGFGVADLIKQYEKNCIIKFLKCINYEFKRDNICACNKKYDYFLMINTYISWNKISTKDRGCININILSSTLRIHHCELGNISLSEEDFRINSITIKRFMSIICAEDFVNFFSEIMS